MNGLLFITHQTAQHDYVSSALIALEGGCRQIQLRMKEAADDEVEAAARMLKPACDRLGASLYIDDRVDVCRRVQATGVHLGREDMPPAQAREMLGNGYVIGGTANTFDDIRRLVAAGVDYIGLGPFRFTETKQRLSPLLGLEGYRTIIDRCRTEGIDCPIFAIGGITADDIPAIMTTGVAGIALSGAILSAADPVAETSHIINLMNNFAHL